MVSRELESSTREGKPTVSLRDLVNAVRTMINYRSLHVKDYEVRSEGLSSGTVLVNMKLLHDGLDP